VRREELIVKDVARNVVADGRTRYDRWRLNRDDARQAGAAPSIALTTVREWAADPRHPDPGGVRPSDIVVVDVAGSERANFHGGPAFGTLVHAVLAQSAFDAAPDEIGRMAELEARILGLDGTAARAAGIVVRRVFAHDLVRRATAAAIRGACRRETPVSCTLPDGKVVEGVVDLAFEEAGHWYVVDYKTDRDFPTLGEDEYRRQVALYASAISQATGLPASGVVIRV
jgi:ATP-dependent exoDNAse (exonuclease V) beta subunit